MRQNSILFQFSGRLADKNNMSGSSAAVAKKMFDVRNDQAIDFGRADTLRYNILSLVLEEKYEYALKSLNDKMTRRSEFPDFNQKTERYFSHCIDLVYAIKAKRNFPGINSLTRAKQQELREKFKIHLKELQVALSRIEQIEYELKVKDIRSTVYIVRACWLAGILIIGVLFVREVTNNIAATGVVVVDDLFDKTLNALFKILDI